MGNPNVVDLVALTARAATPMADPQPQPKERVETGNAEPRPAARTPARRPKVKAQTTERVPTAELVNLSFKVPPAFRRRFRNMAHNAEIKQNELLFAALEAWLRADPKREE